MSYQWKRATQIGKAHAIPPSGGRALCGASPKDAGPWLDEVPGGTRCDTCEGNAKPHPAFERPYAE